ncbi:MAG: ABC transporter permease [Bryobacteraceae bacterium]
MSIFDSTWQDFRFGVRTLRNNPGVTLVAIFSLALGIGANTAIFNLIDSVLVKSLPVRDPQRLVLLSDPSSSGVSMGTQSGVRSLFSFDEYRHIRDRQQVFDGMFASESNTGKVSASIDGGAGENIRPRLVTGSYFSVLGIHAFLGRTFAAEEDRVPHAAPYAVLSYPYWAERFGKRGDVLGKKIRINHASLTVIGVTPPGFFGETVGDTPDVWIPMTMEPDVKPGLDWLHDDESRVERVMWLQVMGRLKPGVGMKQAQANISVVFQQILSGYRIASLDAQHRREMLEQKIQLREGGKGASSLRGEFAQPLFVLMTVVGLVLLIACANIANLLLARAAAREKEIAVRLALGVGRWRLSRQLLTESLVLSLAGGALGVVLAAWGTRILLRVVSNGPQPVPLDVHTDVRVLGFTLALTILTGIIFGLAPTLRGMRVDVASTLKENSRSLIGRGGRVNLGKVLVAGQIAISLLLLIGAGLFIRTLQNLKNVQLGYSREKLIVAGVDSVTAGYKGAAAADLYMRLLDEIRAIPGVKSATFSQNGLFGGSESGTRLGVEGYTPQKQGDTGARFDQVGPGYFSALGIPLLRGREIGRQDTAASTSVCVINQAMAHDFFAKRDPLGKHIKDLFPGSTAEYEIVGVAQDVRDHNLRGKIPRRFYVPVTHPLPVTPPFVNYEIRTVADPAGIIAAVRKKVHDVDHALPAVNFSSLNELVDRRVVQERIIAQLSAFFGALALLLASIGLYGVLSYSVARRTNEIGIRMAVGAEQRTVMWMILRETLVLVAVGGVVGIGASMALARLVASRMFGVGASDPVTMIAAAAVLTAVAMLAACLPAIRAARVDPMTALRVE